MSSGSQEQRAKLLGELERELRQFNGLGASFFRAAAARIGMTVTDMQVIDLLDSGGPMTAGQLADLTGLTTGAITGMLNRLEEGGLLRRERDPGDGRRVIVRLEKGKDELQKISSIFDNIGANWDEMTAPYDNTQLAFLLEFLKSNNALSRQEIVRLREAPANEDGLFSAPLGDLKSGRLVVSSGVTKLTLRTNEAMTKFYQARFEGPPPEIKVKDEVVTIRYSRRLWAATGMKRAAEIALSPAIPWQIVIQGGASQIEANLANLKLAGLEVKGGLNTIELDLPVPFSMVRLRISGSASDITVRRPKGVAARVHLKGWVSEFVFDEQSSSSLGNDVRMQSPGFQATGPGYDIEVASSASMVTITSDG